MYFNTKNYLKNNRNHTIKYKKKKPAIKLREEQQMCNCHGHICQGRANPYAFYSPFLVIYSWLQHLFVRSRTSMHKRPWRQLTVFLDMYNIVSSTFVFQSQSLVSTLVFFFHPPPPPPQWALYRMTKGTFIFNTSKIHIMIVVYHLFDRVRSIYYNISLYLT